MALFWPKSPTPSNLEAVLGPAGAIYQGSADYGIPINTVDPATMALLREVYPHWLDERAGVPLRLATNYARNPSVETNTTDLSSFLGSTGGTGGSTSVARITSDSRFGSACAQWTLNQMTGGTSNYAAIFHQQYTTVPLLQASAMPVVPGQTVWLTGSYKYVSGGQPVSIQLMYRFHDAAGTFLSQNAVVTTPSPVAGTWYDAIASAVAPANAAYVLVRIQVNLPDGGTQTIVNTDGVGTYDANPYSYFDGGLYASTAWEGAAHASRSYKPLANEVQNPNVTAAVGGTSAGPWSSSAFSGSTVGTAISRNAADSPTGVGASAETTFQAGTSASGTMQTYSVATSFGQPLAVRADPGGVFSAGMWIKVVSGLASVSRIRAEIGFKTSANAFVAQPFGAQLVPNGSWQFVKVENAVTPAGVGLNGIAYPVATATANGTDAPVVVRVSRVMFVRAAALPYWAHISGDMNGSQWLGAADGSPSLKLV